MTEKVQELQEERFLKVTFRELPKDLVRAQYDVQSVSEEEIMLAISELATILPPEYLTRLSIRIDELLSGKVKELPEGTSVN